VEDAEREALSEQHGKGIREPLDEDDALVRLLLEAQHERACRPRPEPADGTPPRNSAFTEFVRRTERRLAQQVLPMVRGDVHQAEDVVQETYLRVWRGLAKFDPSKLAGGGPFAWLTTIAHNTAVSLSRRRRPVACSSLGAADGLGLPDPAAPEPGPSARRKTTNATTPCIAPWPS
jgi:DNA-directed RNA polymerase specialized sigma24 family protein